MIHPWKWTFWTQESPLPIEKENHPKYLNVPAVSFQGSILEMWGFCLSKCWPPKKIWTIFTLDKIYSRKLADLGHHHLRETRGKKGVVAKTRPRRSCKSDSLCFFGGSTLDYWAHGHISCMYTSYWTCQTTQCGPCTIFFLTIPWMKIINGLLKIQSHLSSESKTQPPISCGLSSQTCSTKTHRWKNYHHGYITLISHDWPRHAPNQLARRSGKSMATIRPLTNSIHLAKVTCTKLENPQECVFSTKTVHQMFYNPYTIYWEPCCSIYTTTNSLVPRYAQYVHVY